MSKLFTLQVPDFAKGLLMVVLGAVLTTLEQVVSTGGFSAVNWSAVALVAVNAGLAYLVKQFGTDSQGTAFGIAATTTNTRVAP